MRIEHVALQVAAPAAATAERIVKAAVDGGWMGR